jgi:ribosomal protein S18 acetylase RimI-like enzyme
MIIKSGHELDGILTSLYDALGLPLQQAYGCLYGATGLNIPLLNGVAECNLAASQCDACVEHIAEHYTAQGLPYSWWVSKSCEPDGLANALQKQGLTFWGELLGLTAQLDRTIEPKSLQEVQLVETENDLEVWNQVVSSCWGFSETDTQKHLRLYQNRKVPLYHVVGKKEGHIVAAASLLCHKGGAFLYNLATLPAARRQGFATSLLWKLIQLAKDQGYTQVGLQTLPELFALFQNLGFQHTSGFNIYGLSR